jgi:hypothetical protein
MNAMQKIYIIVHFQTRQVVSAFYFENIEDAHKWISAQTYPTTYAIDYLIKG